MSRRRALLTPLIALSLAGLPPAGCQSLTDQERAAQLNDADAAVNDRVAAVRARRALHEAGEGDQAAFREEMKRIAWRRSEPPRLRLEAIEALLTDDPEDTARMLALMLPTETQWSVIGAVSEMAARRGWKELTPALVRSWARPVQEPADADRPERAALLALHPRKAPVEIVFDVFLETRGEGLFGEQTRRDAWALLGRVDPDGSTIAGLLADADRATDDPLLSDLQAAAGDLGAVPRTAEQLDWLRALREPERRPFYEEAAAAIESLTPEQREGLELRHAAPIRLAAKRKRSLLRAPHAELRRELSERLRGRRGAPRYADSAEAMYAAPDDLEDWEAELVWADLLLILLADEAIHQPDVVRAIFEQVDHDRRDKSTEHGGVLRAREATDSSMEDGFVAVPFPPRPAQRAGDNRFTPSPSMVEAGHTALIDYHFHAQRVNNAEYAGPGAGDLRTAQRLGRSSLVLTSLSRDELNVDYYQPDGARLDLGRLRRP